MPHIIIDYGQGGAGRVAIDELTRAVHRRVRDGGLVKPTVVRTFAREAALSCVGDEHPDNHFVQIIVRMAPGRPAELKRELLKSVLKLRVTSQLPRWKPAGSGFAQISTNPTQISRFRR